MSSPEFFPALYFYLGESVIEAALAIALVVMVLRFAHIESAAVRLRFYLLPLLIPSVLSPAAHLLLPQLSESALIAHVERIGLPFGTLAFESSRVLAPYILAIFGTLLAIGMLQWFVGSARHWRWLGQQRAQDARALERVERQLRTLTPRDRIPPPAILLTAPARGPYAWGGGRGWIAIPHDLLQALDDEELAALLAHELAHVQRGDTWLRLVARLARDLQFFNPLAHWVYRRIETLCEDACDDLAVQMTGNPLALASSLLKTWRTQQTGVQVWAHTLVSSQVELERRVTRLLAAQVGLSSRRREEIVFASATSALVFALSIV